MPALVWLLIAVGLAVGEVFTLDLVLLMLAGAALAGGGAALLTDSLAVQALAAGVTGLVLLGLVRPVVRRHLEVPAALPSGGDRLRGRTATVIEAVTADSGQVRVDGELWRARPWSGCPDVSQGSTVVVAAVEGATLQVYPEELV